MNALILLRDWQESQIEFWKPIEGFPGHDISTFGRVRTWWRRKPHTQGNQVEIGPEPRLMKLQPFYLGYWIVYLRKVGAKTRKNKTSRFVHRLVAQAFIKNPQGLKEVNHITGLKSDSRVDGLEWSTRRKNLQHAYNMGLRDHQLKLTSEQVVELRAMYRRGVPPRVLAVHFGLSRPHASRIARGGAYTQSYLQGD